MLPELSRQILTRLAEGMPIEDVAVSVADGKMTYDWQHAVPTAAGEMIPVEEALHAVGS